MAFFVAVRWTIDAGPGVEYETYALWAVGVNGMVESRVAVFVVHPFQDTVNVRASGYEAFYHMKVCLACRLSERHSAIVSRVVGVNLQPGVKESVEEPYVEAAPPHRCRSSEVGKSERACSLHVRLASA